MKEPIIISPTIPLDSGFTHLFLNIAAQGYHWIKINYSGGGDDGSIDEVELIPKGCLDIIDNNLVWSNPKYKAAEMSEELSRKVEDFAYSQVLNSLEDWWNNDGGGGAMYISTLDSSYHINHYIVTRTEEESVITGKLGDA